MSLTAVQTYDFHILTTVYSPLHRFIWNQHSDQLPVGLLAQLVEHCTGIAEVMDSNPVQAWIFFRSSFHYYLSSVLLQRSLLYSCLPYLFLKSWSRWVNNLTSFVWNCVIIEFCCVSYHIVIYNIIIQIAFNTLAQAVIHAWCSLPMFIPELNIDIWKWSQDMWVLKGGNLGKQGSSFN